MLRGAQHPLRFLGFLSRTRGVGPLTPPAPLSMTLRYAALLRAGMERGEEDRFGSIGRERFRSPLPHPPGPLLHNVEKGEEDRFIRNWERVFSLPLSM